MIEFTTALKKDLKRWIAEGLIFEADSDLLQVPIQMIPVGFSREIVYGYTVRSFAVDGFVAVPLANLDQIWRRPTDRMHHEEMRLMGRLDSLPEPPLRSSAPQSIVDYLDAIASDELVAIDFAYDDESQFERLGWITAIEERAFADDDADDGADNDADEAATEPVVTLRCVTGSGRIEDGLEEIDIVRITAVEIRSRYLEGYRRYFARVGRPPHVEPE